jgi:hypothetical protein
MLALAGLAGAAVAGCSGPGRPGQVSRPRVSYYLALGDSLSVRAQPDASGTSVPTGQGYASQLYAILGTEQPGLRLVKLGCIGETTVTMIHGGICRYLGVRGPAARPQPASEPGRVPGDHPRLPRRRGAAAGP